MPDQPEGMEKKGVPPAQADVIPAQAEVPPAPAEVPPAPAEVPPAPAEVPPAPADGPPADVEAVSLQFVDLLYAVPVADLALRISDTHLDHVTGAGWTDVAVALTAITLGWIGHHANRRRLPRKLREQRAYGRQFWTLRFPQFTIEILVIIAYFALGAKAYLPNNVGVGTPSESWKALWLIIIFGLYIGWDVLDIWIASHAQITEWRNRALCGLIVTTIFTIIFVLVYVLWASPFHPGKPPYHSVVLFDLVLILLLYLYRVVQEWRVGKISLPWVPPV